MNVSKVIKRLEKLMRIHGDLPVRRYSCALDSGVDVDVDVGIISAYSNEGGSPSEENLAVEIYIH